jgi:hypothetical protein
MPPLDRTLASRFELKYWLPPHLVPAVRRAIQPFVRPDRFARRQPDHAYAIGSLYLDSPDLQLYRTTVEGHRNRFKLRIRAYDDHPESPVFLEIKRRADQVVLKRRARVTRELALDIVRGRLPRGAADIPAVSEFVRSVDALGAGPVMRVRYRREAYESSGRDPVRITFDRELAHAVTHGPELSLDGGGWFETPTEGQILEVKFTDCCPSWVQSMVSGLGLERRSVPKYILSVDSALGRAAGLRPLGLPVERRA